MPALLGHNAFTYYAQNYAGIIRMSLLPALPKALDTNETKSRQPEG